MFHTIERELSWRRENGKPEGFEALRACKPVVAVGANRPLQDKMMMADYFRETLPPAFVGQMVLWATLAN